MLRYLTAGESHGKEIIAILEGIPAGLKISEQDVNTELKRRQFTFGRGPRLQKIESDKVEIVSGVRWGETIGSPITLKIQNKDWPNWEKILSIHQKDKDLSKILTKPRPGHSDLTGVLKYNRYDIRDIFERASARETVARVAVGAVCKKFLKIFDITIFSYVKQIGKIKIIPKNYKITNIYQNVEKSSVRCPQKEYEKKMILEIEKARKNGDTIGGVYTILVENCPVGLGSYVQWDKKISGRIAQAIMSIQAHKAVEIGLGFSFADKKGSEVADIIIYDKQKGFYRKTNNSGGIESGMTNGEQIVINACVKPLASLQKPLVTVDLKTKKIVDAEIIRSDICAVPSAAIIGEAVVAFEISNAFVEKFGGDSITEITQNYKSFKKFSKTY